MTRAIVPKMMDRGEGSIVNMASIVGIDGNVGQSNYAATKGGVISMTKTWAKEFSRKGAQIRVNAIAPGFFPTELTAPVYENPGLLDKLAAQTAIGRNGALSDLDGLTVFLAATASDYLTGQVIHLDGGFTAK